MNRKLKVFVVGYGNGYARAVTNRELVDNPEDADIIVFTGGEDINPALYGERESKRTGYNNLRDDFEVDWFKKLPKDKLKLGICRGAQLFCAMAGGKLVQDVSNHAGYSHDIVTFTGETMRTNSLHHQMMFPFNLSKDKYQLLAWSKYPQSTRYIGALDQPMELPEDFVEPEIVYFPEINALGIQGHPEAMNSEDTMVVFINNFLYKLLDENK